MIYTIKVILTVLWALLLISVITTESSCILAKFLFTILVSATCIAMFVVG